MNTVFKSFVLAFSKYPISPKARIKEDKEGAEKYILLFVPLIGFIIGGLIYICSEGWPYLCNYAILPAVVCVILPIIISGGGHLEGFIKTVDALCAHKSREKKMEILADSHGGYFAIIVCLSYYLLDIGIWSEMPIDGIPILAIGFVMSRALFGLSILTLNHADESKCISYVPEKSSVRMFEIIVLGLLACVGAYFMVFFNASVGLACVVGALLTFIYYWLVTQKHFGGITEDSAGFFLQLCEIIIPLAALLAYKKWW